MPGKSVIRTEAVPARLADFRSTIQAVALPAGALVEIVGIAHL